MKLPTKNRAFNEKRREGQTLIFMAMVVLMIAFAALVYFDISKVFHVKSLSNNGADAAALAGARWQAISLNLIGSLNVAQAAALTDALSSGNAESEEMLLIADLQRRIHFSGPMLGLVAAQQAAKQNGVHNNEEFESEMRSHVSRVLLEYTAFDEPFVPSGGFDNGWQELADMYSLVGEQGMAVQPALQYYGIPTGPHILLSPDFYDAVRGRNWCWFYWNAYGVLLSYTNYTDWGLTVDDLEGVDIDPHNAEFLSLQLSQGWVLDRVPVLPTGSEWEESFTDLIEAIQSADPLVLEQVRVEWSTYNPEWGGWITLDDGFPWDREIRQEFDYGGGDSVMTVRTETPRLSNVANLGKEENDEFVENRLSTIAAAKPFGSLPGEDGLVPPNTYGVVIPAFTDVRLIPVGTANSTGQGGHREGWVEFVVTILPAYLESGPIVLSNWPGNYFAQQLVTWEIPGFRQAGITWIENYADTCRQPSGPGGGPGGGTNFGR